jgi:hypothetical protein
MGSEGTFLSVVIVWSVLHLKIFKVDANLTLMSMRGVALNVRS